MVVPDDYVGFMAMTIVFEHYQFDLDDLSTRVWSIAAEDIGDGARLFKPRAR